MRRALAVAAMVLTACGGDPTGSPPTTAPVPTLTGTLLLRQEVNEFSGAPCGGTGGYSDVREGAQVTVTDGESAIVGVGRLGPGVTQENRRTSATVYSYCTFAFSVPSIPDRPFYKIEVAHRGALSYAHDDLAAKNWTVGLTLG